jgi:hypothetical protein
MQTGHRGEMPDSAAPFSLLLPIYAFAVVMGCWTLAYHLIVWTDGPAGWIWLPFLVFMALAVSSTFREMRSDRSPPEDRRVLLGVLIFGIATGIASLSIAYYNPDDVNYLHRALLQLRHLDQPFELGQSYFTRGVLPPLSIAHGLTSYEIAVTFGADLIGLDPVWAYQKAAGFAGHLLFAFVFTALYRELGLSRWRALLAAVLVFGFCLLDLRIPGRSYGNSIIALYNGKVLLWGVGLPALLLFAIRYLDRPCKPRLLWLSLAAVAMIGLSGSAIFMVPALLGGVGAAYFLSAPPSKERLIRAASIQAASGYALVIGFVGLLGGGAELEDLSAFNNFPDHWLENLALVTDRPSVAIRDAILLVAAPSLALSSERRRLLLWLSPVLILAFATPLTGPILVDLLTPGAYWRMAYLLPVTLCAGLSFEALVVAFANRRRWMPLVAVIGPVAILYTFVHARDWPFTRLTSSDDGSIDTRVPLGSLSGLRLPQPQIRFASENLKHLSGRTVLGSIVIFPTLALLDPTLQFETGRWVNHSFSNFGDPAEGDRRDMAGSVVSQCRSGPSRRAAFLESVRLGVDAIVVGPCFDRSVGRAVIFGLLEDTGAAWSRPLSHAGFSLLLRASITRR